MYLHWEGRRGYRTRMPAPRVLNPLSDLSYGERCGNMTSSARSGKDSLRSTRVSLAT
jgi:hypothetical protein